MKLYVYILVLIGVGIAIAILEPRIKGWFGEKTVSVILSKLNSSEYKIINDVILKTARGTSQIDHVIVSIYGIFVIETKNYKGWITGNEFSEQWTKNMYGKKYQFRNPILQNYGHVKALEEFLSISENCFFPIVVFSTKATLKVKTCRPVVYTVKLNKEIRKHKDIKFTIDEVNDLVSKITDININTKETKKKHVNNVKTEVKEKQEKIQNHICPKCGGKLIERTGKYGNFLGCSNFPNCKYKNNKKTRQ